MLKATFRAVLFLKLSAGVARNPRIISGLQPFVLIGDPVPGPTQSTAPTLATISQAVGPEFENE